MKLVVTRNDGWEAADGSRKLGYVATKEGASFDMEFNNLSASVQTLNFLVMKSYGEKWEGSRIKVDAVVTTAAAAADAEVGNEHSKSIEITGFHDRQTSETYTVQLDLRSDGQHGARKSDNLKVSIKLIGGSTFKIMGMAFCDH